MIRPHGLILKGGRAIMNAFKLTDRNNKRLHDLLHKAEWDFSHYSRAKASPDVELYFYIIRYFYNY